MLMEGAPGAAGVHGAFAHIRAAFLPLETLPGQAPLRLLPEHLSADAGPQAAQGVEVRAPQCTASRGGPTGLGPDVNGETLGASYPENRAPDALRSALEGHLVVNLIDAP